MVAADISILSSSPLVLSSAIEIISFLFNVMTPIKYSILLVWCFKRTAVSVMLFCVVSMNMNSFHSCCHLLSFFQLIKSLLLSPKPR